MKPSDLEFSYIVREAQQNLVNNGNEEVKVDGDYGPLTRAALRKTYPKIAVLEQPSAMATTTSLSPTGYQLILDHEVGGGSEYYGKILSRATVPGGESGITIGVGYDLGYEEVKDIEADWLGKIPFNPIVRSCFGVKGAAASKLLQAVSASIGVIPWKVAETVYRNRTIPREIAKVYRYFPGSEKLTADAFAVLVSIGFNRGFNMDPDDARRKEMVAIKDLVKEGSLESLQEVPGQIRDMKRLWGVENKKTGEWKPKSSSVGGLIIRREAEASLWEKSYGKI